MRSLFYFIIVACLVVSIYTYSMVSISKIFLKPFDRKDIKAIDFSQIKSGRITVRVNSSIKNENNFDIKFSDLIFNVFYNEQIVCTSPNSHIIVNNKVVDQAVIPKNSIFSFQKDVEIYIPGEIPSIVKNLALKIPVQMEYNLKFNVYGVKVPTITDKFTV